jgi:hypothetical protein
MSPKLSVLMSRRSAGRVDAGNLPASLRHGVHHRPWWTSSRQDPSLYLLQQIAPAKAAHRCIVDHHRVERRLAVMAEPPAHVFVGVPYSNQLLVRPLPRIVRFEQVVGNMRPAAAEQDAAQRHVQLPALACSAVSCAFATMTPNGVALSTGSPPLQSANLRACTEGVPWSLATDIWARLGRPDLVLDPCFFRLATAH